MRREVRSTGAHVIDLVVQRRRTTDVHIAKAHGCRGHVAASHVPPSVCDTPGLALIAPAPVTFARGLKALPISKLPFW